MTVYPFPNPHSNASGLVDAALDRDEDRFPDDFVDFDDATEEMARYGSADRQYRFAHRTISATVLALLTGVQIPVCQSFHHVFFSLLELVGDFDGIVGTPTLLIAGDRERITRASEWLANHPQPDVPTIIASLDIDELFADLDDSIEHCIDQHSLGLAIAVGANPSATMGSLVHLQERLIDDVLELLHSCRKDEIDRLTDTALDLLGRMPESIHLVGGATLRRLTDSAIPPLSV